MIEDVKVAAPEANKVPSGEQLVRETASPAKLETPSAEPEGQASQASPRRRGRPLRQLPSELETTARPPKTPPAAVREPDREEILRRYGPVKGQQILDAAAGRKPPYTRPVSPLRREEGSVDTGPATNRELHLLPRPIAFDLTPDQFFKYWALLSADELERIKVYPYRMWPVVDVNLPLSEEELDLIRRHEKKPPSRNLGLLKQPLDWKNWQAEIYHRFGAGDYNFKLNDTHPAIRRTICQTAIVGVLRDMDTYPPACDPKMVVKDDPANESYIRWCRLKGVRLPGDQIAGEESRSMAEARGVELIGNMTDKLLTHALDGKKGDSGDAVSEAIKSVTSLMTSASEKSQQLLVDSINKRAVAEDPVSFHQRVMDTAKELYGGGNGGGTTAILESMKMMMEQQANSHKSQLDQQEKAHQSLLTLLLGNQKSLEDRLVRAEERAQKAQDKVLELQLRPAGAPQLDANGQPLAPRTMGQQMGEITTMVNGLMKLVETVSARANPVAEDRMGPIGRAVLGLVENAPNMLYNLAVARNAGQPNAPPPQPPPEPGEVEEAPAQPQPMSEEEAGQRLLMSLEQPLTRALSEGLNGAEFGARLMVTHGPAVYELIASQNDDALVAFLQNSPVIMRSLQQAPQRSMAFLAEFREVAKVQELYERIRASTLRPRPAPRAERPAERSAERPAERPAERSAGGGRQPRPGTRIVYGPAGPVEVQSPGEQPRSPGPGSGPVIDAQPETPAPA